MASDTIYVCVCCVLSSCLFTIRAGLLCLDSPDNYHTTTRTVAPTPQLCLARCPSVRSVLGKPGPTALQGLSYNSLFKFYSQIVIQSALKHIYTCCLYYSLRQVIPLEPQVIPLEPL